MAHSTRFSLSGAVELISLALDPPPFHPCFLEVNLLELLLGRGLAGDVALDAAGERALRLEDVFDGVADGARMLAPILLEPELELA